MTQKTFIGTHSIGIVGSPGSGKTIMLKNCFEAIRANTKVKTISINCSNSSLTWKVDEVVKNKISKDAALEESSTDIEILDVSWQDIEFEGRTVEVPTKVIGRLMEKIIKFVEKSDIPCVIIIEEIWMFEPQKTKGLMQLLNVVVQRGGYFIFTSLDRDKKFVNLFLNRVEEVIDCDGYLGFSHYKNMCISNVQEEERIKKKDNYYANV